MDGTKLAEIDYLIIGDFFLEERIHVNERINFFPSFYSSH